MSDSRMQNIYLYIYIFSNFGNVLFDFSRNILAVGEKMFQFVQRDIPAPTAFNVILFSLQGTSAEWVRGLEYGQTKLVSSPVVRVEQDR